MMNSLAETGMYFYNTNYGGGLGGGLSGLNSNPLQLIIEGGAQLYQGSENSPSFSTGTFASGKLFIAPFNVAFTNDTNPGPIVITAAPEPKTGLLLGLGFCVVAVFCINNYRRRLSFLNPKT